MKKILLIILFCFLIPIHAHAWKWGGEFKNYATGTDLQQNWYLGKRWLWDEILNARIRVQGTLIGRLDLSAEYHLVSQWGDSIRYTDQLASVSSFFGVTGACERYFDLESALLDESNALVTNEIDRLWLRYHAPSFDITLGRMALSWGSGFGWNPLDVINPIPPSNRESDTKSGTDMLLIEAPLGTLAEVALVAKPVTTKESDALDEGRSAILSRIKVNLKEIDFTLMGGKYRTDSMIGGSVSGVIKDASVWIEGTYTHPENKNDFLRLVTGFNYMTGSEYVIIGEYYYNSLGAENPDHYQELLFDQEFIGRLERGEIYNLGRHYTAISIEKELSPLNSASLHYIMNMADHSFLFSPSWRLSVTQNTELQVYAAYSYGKSNSEYGKLAISMGAKEIFVPIPDTYVIAVAYYF